MTIRVPDPVIQPEHVDLLLGAAGLAPPCTTLAVAVRRGSSHVEVYADPSTAPRRIHRSLFADQLRSRRCSTCASPSPTWNTVLDRG